MQPTLIRAKPYSRGKSRRIGGIILIALGLIIIAMNMFFIVVRKGHVSTASKALLPLSCILIIAGWFLCCTSVIKYGGTRPESDTSEDNFTSNIAHTSLRYNTRSGPIISGVSQPPGQGTGPSAPSLCRTPSVTEVEDLPPSYEDCVRIDVNSRVNTGVTNHPASSDGSRNNLT